MNHTRRHGDTRWTENFDTPIAQDGILGPKTIGALQYGLDVDVTGVLDKHTITKLQYVLFNVTPTPAGILGKVTTKALERKLGVPQTGDVPWNHDTVLSLQYTLNQGAWGLGLPPEPVPVPVPPQPVASPPPPPPVPIPAPAPAPSTWVASVGIDNKSGISYARYTAGGTIAQWIASACKARGVTDPAAINNWTKGCETAITRESDGDANSCNTNDLNDVTPSGFSQVNDWGTGYGNPNGDLNGRLVNYQCSRGVLQCIPQTFASFHCPGTSNMIYDPVASITAAMGYVVTVYGVSHDGHDLAAKVQQFDPSRPPRGY
jgi:hypothetical protein